MFSSLSNSVLCAIQTCNADIQQILRRITPITYTTELLSLGNEFCPSSKGTLVVDSNQYIYGQLYFPTCSGGGVGTIINGDMISTMTIYTQNIIGVSGTSGGSTGPTGSVGPTGNVGNSEIDVLVVDLAGETPLWANSGIQDPILSITLPKAGVWEIVAKFSLYNDTDVFLDFYSVTYGIDTETLTTSYYTGMATTQFLSYEFVQIVELTSPPETFNFNVIIEYDELVGRGVIFGDNTSVTAVRLGDVAT